MLAWLLETFRKSFIVHLIFAVAGCRPKMNGKKLLTTYLFLPIWFFLIKYLNNAVSSLYIRLYIDWLIKYIWLIGLFNACDTKEASMHIQPTIRSQHIVFSSGNRRNEWDIHVKFLFSPTCQQYIGEFYYLWMECTLFTPPNSHMYIWYEFSVFSLNWRLLVKWIRTTPAYMVWGICPSIFVNILKDLDGRISCIWLLITWKTIPICYIPVHFRCVWRSDMIILMLNNILWIFCRVIATWKTSHWICLGRFTMANIWFNYSFSRISANVKYSSPSLEYFMTLSIIRDFLTLNKITMCAGIW